MKTVFIADPAESFIIKKDTTHALMNECFRRNHTVYHALPNQISTSGQNLIIEASEYEVSDTHLTRKGDAIPLSQNDIGTIFIRTDPPFDASYLSTTWLLSNFKSQIPIINNPDGIRSVNEKIWVSQFTEFVPTTLISSSKTQLNKFIGTHEKCIAKPLNGYGGSGIFILDKNDPNKNVILESVSRNYTDAIILQEYLEEAKIGDKRVLLLNGDILGATLRVHNASDHRNNFFAGGSAKKADITAKERHIIEQMKPYLRELGLYFVGLDFIGERLIEVNVTSPTCLKEINALNHCQLEVDIIDFVETLIK